MKKLECLRSLQSFLFSKRNIILAINRINHAAIYILLLSFIVLSNVSIGQNNTIVGSVRNEAGEPLRGVSVTVKGRSMATTTNEEGNYSINVPTSNSVLQFTSIGYAPQELQVGKQTVLNVQLKSQAGTMEEVVVVGYGSKKRTSLTGSVATVDAKTFQDRGPVSSPLAALQGQAPGVSVTRSSSQPGRENWNFQVRGATSVNGTEPLIIVDGLPIPSTSALNSFNPNDIESISFLKDAAASIYGARAAGGVVLITTKRAKAGKTVVEYNGSISRKKVGLLPELTRILDWSNMMIEARTSDGFTPADPWITYGRIAQYSRANNKFWVSRAEWQALIAPNGPIAGGGIFGDVRDYMFFDNTLQDYLWGNATSTDHQLSLSSRTDKTGYRISLGYLNDGSLLQVGNNSNTRYNLRLAHDYQLTSKIKLESNISLEKNDIVQPTGLGAMMNNGIQPGIPAKTIDGKPYIWGSGLNNAAINSVGELGGDNKEMNTRINANFNVTYNIIKNLKAVGNVGYYFHNTDYRTRQNIIDWYDYSGTELLASLSASGSGRSFYQRSARRESYYNVNGYLDYSNTIGDHSFSAMAGAQYERDEMNRFLARTLDPLPGAPSSLSNNYSTDLNSKTVDEAQNHYALAGYFSRLNYTFKNKYLFEANARYDGSSRFEQSSRWKFFSGILGAWRLKQESFLQDVRFLSDLKLRASWGSVGNQSGIGLYDYIQFLNANFSGGQTSAGFPIIGNAPVIRVSPGGLVAFDRTWETVQTTNFGLDYAFLNNRLNGTFDYFIKQNKNMLISRTLPAVLGATPPEGNNGHLRTKGWELAIQWRDRIGNFSYNIGGNISDARSNLVSFGGQNLIRTDINRGFNFAVEGYPINSYFGLVYDGRIQDQKTLDEYRKFIPGNNVGIPTGGPTAQANQRLSIGDNMYKDLNGDGRITFPEDVQYLGTDDPRYTYGINGGANYKGFDLSFIFQGVGKRTIIRDGNWRIPAGVVFQSQNAAFLNKWWTPERTDAFYPRISTTGTINNYNYYPSTFVVENGAYLRLKNLVVGYTLPHSISDKAKIQRLRLYFSGNDLWEISNIRDGWDPEAPRTVNNSGDSNNGGVSTFSQRFPFYRYYTVGLNVTF